MIKGYNELAGNITWVLKMKAIIEKRYQSSEHLDYPKMERLIDRVMENPKRDFTIPKEFLHKKHNCPTFLDILIHKIKVFAKSFWINIKKMFNESYRNNFKLAVKKIIKAYEEASRVKEVVQEIFPDDTQDHQIKMLHEQQAIEDSTKLKIEQEIPEANHNETETPLTLQETEQSTQDQPQKEPLLEIPQPIQVDHSPLLRTQSLPLPIIPSSPQIQQKETQKLVEEVEKTAEIEVKIKKKSPFEVMNETIKEMTSNDNLSGLWQTLWSNDTNIEKNVASWSCNSIGDFTIRLHEPLRLWINTRGRKGGCVFNFDKVIRGALGNNKIIFHQGFTSLCYHKIGYWHKRVNPTMNSIHYVSDKKIITNGTCYGMSQDNNSSYRTMKDEWSNKVTVIPDAYRGGYEEFLEKKYNA
jgi:hypothetical protein